MPLCARTGGEAVTIARNACSDGFNKRVDTDTMAASEVTVTGDDPALNATTPPTRP